MKGIEEFHGEARNSDEGIWERQAKARLFNNGLLKDFTFEFDESCLLE